MNMARGKEICFITIFNNSLLFDKYVCMESQERILNYLNYLFI